MICIQLVLINKHCMTASGTHVCFISNQYSCLKCYSMAAAQCTWHHTSQKLWMHLVDHRFRSKKLLRRLLEMIHLVDMLVFKNFLVGICILWCSTWWTAHRIIIDDDHDDDTWFCLLLKHCTAQLRSSLIKVWKRETCHFLCIPQFPSGLNAQLFVSVFMD